MQKLNYVKHETIRLKNHPDFNEKWLQERLEENPALFGLGDVVVVERERKQSSGGKLDFLLNDPETNTMYEVELMLGATDESHIIRTIEYWDIESRRFPSRDHKAVIIAEEITKRFFNVIGLMSRSIPIIAIKLHATTFEDKIFLDFIPVLDIYEEPAEEELLDGEVKDRGYWEGRSNPKSMEVFDGLVALSKAHDPNVRITYNKNHIAVGTSRRNFSWYTPRHKEGYCRFYMRVGRDNIEKAKEIFENAGIAAAVRREDKFAVPLHMVELKEKRNELNQVFDLAIYSGSVCLDHFCCWFKVKFLGRQVLVLAHLQSGIDPPRGFVAQ